MKLLKKYLAEALVAIGTYMASYNALNWSVYEDRTYYFRYEVLQQFALGCALLVLGILIIRRRGAS